MRIQSNCYGSFPMRLDPALSASDFVRNNQLSIYPNPASDVLNIAYEGVFSTLQLVRADGSVVRTVTPDSNNTVLNIENLGAGIYFVRGVSENGILTQKVVLY